MFSFILVVCLAGALCLTPLTVYLFWLSTLNRRGRPTVIAGGWDFAALVGGLSGFILFGGGLMLTLIQSNARFFMRGNFEALRDAWGQDRLVWSLIVIAYLLLVVGGVVVTLLGRRRTLVVYHVDPDQFEVALAELMDHIGRPVERRGNVWLGSGPLFELEPFAAGRTVTLRWVADDRPLFQEVERHVREAAGGLPDGPSPAARWLVSAVVGCTVVIGFCVVLLLYGLALIR